MTSVLDEIIVGVREDLSIRQEKTSIEELKALAEKVPAALDPFPIFDEAGVAVIAEVKRSSPSKGDLSEIVDPALLAKEYEASFANVFLSTSKVFKFLAFIPISLAPASAALLTSSSV